MGKVVAAINMTLDGFCDHTAMIPDDEIHQHYNELLSNSGALVYGRTTYQLMENYWPLVVNKPTGNKPVDEFAEIIENIDKIVFSRTLKELAWKNVRLAKKSLQKEILELKQQVDKDILVGSRSLIVSSMELNLIDEFQLNILPIVIGKGLPLFKDLKTRIMLNLINTKTFKSGAVLHYYVPKK